MRDYGCVYLVLLTAVCDGMSTGRADQRPGPARGAVGAAVQVDGRDDDSSHAAGGRVRQAAARLQRHQPRRPNRTTQGQSSYVTIVLLKVSDRTSQSYYSRSVIVGHNRTTQGQWSSQSYYLRSVIVAIVLLKVSGRRSQSYSSRSVIVTIVLLKVSDRRNRITQGQ